MAIKKKLPAAQKKVVKKAAAKKVPAKKAPAKKPAAKKKTKPKKKGPWNPIVTRGIAMAMTFVADVSVNDQLAGPKLNMSSPDDRVAYRDRCILAAEDRGHPVPDETDIPTSESTTLGDVGDALFNHSN